MPQIDKILEETQPADEEADEDTDAGEGYTGPEKK